MEEKLSVCISNIGSEIPEGELKKIFNKFYQADKSHATEGNGVGLAIVKRIVELHCGDVYARGGDGMTTFTVEIPNKR